MARAHARLVPFWRRATARALIFALAWQPIATAAAATRTSQPRVSLRLSAPSLAAEAAYAGAAPKSAPPRPAASAPGEPSATLTPRAPAAMRPSLPLLPAATPAHSASADAAIATVEQALSVSITAPATGASVGGTVTVTGSVTGGTAPFTVNVNGVAATMTGASFSAAVTAAAGALTLTATATDSASQTAQASVNATVDTTAPALAITTPANGAVVAGPLVAVAGTASDASGTVSLLVNGDPAAVTAGAFTTSVGRADGPATITAIAGDQAGNSTTVSVNVTVDSAPPVLTVTSPANGALLNAATVQITGTVTDASTTALTIGGATVSIVGGAFTHVAPTGSDGSQVYILTATDAAGNETTQSLTVNVDRTAPTLSFSAPAAGAHVATQPVTVHGLVTDLTTTTVTVNGVAATRTADAWQAVLTLADGPQTLTAVATDAAGNQTTATRNITLDTAGPTVTIAAPAAATLTRLGTIVVSGTVADSSVQSVTVNGVAATVTPQGAGQYGFSASVSLAEGDVALVVTATDSAGHVGTGQVTVTRDSTPPLLDVTAPERLTQRVSGSASVAASDNLSLQQIVVTVNGAAAGTFATSPVQVPLTVPSGAAIGDVVTLAATATDTAGNTATITRTVRVTGDGAVLGQVLSDTTGLPVPGALVQIGAAQVTTDARGQYSFPTADASATAIVSLTGTMSVERQIAVAPEVGTVTVDARLTPLAAAVSVASGGSTVTAGALSLAIPAGAFGTTTGVQLTPLSAQGLPGLLPLGWSPLAAFDLRATATPAGTAALVVSSLPATVAAVTLAQYNTTLHAWTALVVDAAVTAGSVTLPIDAAGAYAVVVQDVETTPLPPAVVGAPLPVSTVVAIPLTATSAGVVSPAILPPAGGTATGVLAVQSPLPLPSGTLVQANATETFTLASGTVASEEQRRQDVILYRLPLPVAAALPAGFAPTVAAAFPITPSRSFGPADLAQGVVHLDILAGREAVRGQVGGGLATTVNSGGARVIVPAGAAPSDTVIAISPTVLSSFLPAPSGVEPLGEIVLDLAGQALVTAAELSLALPGLTVAPTDTLLAARVERLNGVPFLVVVSAAAYQAGRVTTVASPGLAGVRTGGRYVFYRVSLPLGWAQTTVSTASGTTPGAIVDGTGLPFAGVTNASGQALVPAAQGARTLSARMPATALAGSTATTIVVGSTTSVAITIAGITTTATVTPANNATGVPVTAQLQVQSAAALASTAAISTAMQLVRASNGVAVATRLVLSTSAQTLAVVPLQRLAPATTYRLEAASLTDALGGLVVVPQTTFTTAADAELAFDTTRLVVGMPGANGLAAITAPAGTFAPGTTVLIVNTGNGIVLSLTVANDGSLSGSIEAAVYDRLLITVSDPIGRTTSLQRSTYVAADGTTAVGSGGGVVTGPGGVEMRVPEGAIPTAATFKIQAVDYAATYPNDPPTAIPGATIGAAMRIETSHDGRFNQEIDLAFARPAAAPDGAFFYVMRRHVLPTGQVVYETLDHAWEEGTGPNAKVVTASPPFSGYVIGGLTAGLVFLAWTFNQALPRKPMVGTITGKVVRPVFVQGEVMPRYVGVEGATVQAVDVLQNGSTIGYTGKDGTFAIHDALATGGAVNVTATLGGVSVTGTAYQPGPEYQRSDALIPYDTYMVVNLTFPPAAPPPVAPSIAVKVYRQVNGARSDTNGIVTVGEPLTLAFTVANPPTNPIEMRVAEVNGQAITVGVDDVPVPNGELAFKADYTPSQVGALTIVARVDPYSGPDVTQTYIARVVGAGGVIENAPNDPPAVIGARTMPRAGATGVAVTVYPEVSFTEPVTNLPGNVSLVDPQGSSVPIVLIGVGPTGPVPQVQTSSVLTGLTVQPLLGLKFNTTYTLHLTTGIQDQDAPTPKSLVDYTTTFTTFGPTNIGSTANVGASALQVVDNRAYVADTFQGVSPLLRVFDISDPTAPEEIVGPDTGSQLLMPAVPVTVGIGAPTDLAVEDGSALTGGRVLATTVGPQGLPFRPSNVWVYDVSADDAWRLLGAVTLGTEPVDGIAVRVALRGERLFALTRGIGKGIQVVDLVEARNLLQAQTVAGEQSSQARGMLQMLHTAQQGFAQSAIVSTVHIPTGAGANSMQNDMAVVDMVVDGALAPVIVTTGRSVLAIVNPNTGQVFSNGNLLDPQSQIPVFAYGSYIAAGLINGQAYAVVAGVSPSGQNRVATVSLADPRVPQVVGWLNMPAGVMDAMRTRLLLRDGMAYLGGSAGTTVLNLQNPAQPTLAGVVAGLGGLIAVTDSNVLVSAADLYQSAQGLRTAALGKILIVPQPRPQLTRRVPAPAGPPPPTPAPEEEELVVDVPISPRVIGADAATGVFTFFANGVQVAQQLLSFVGNIATTTIASGTRKLLSAKWTMVATAQTADGLLQSVPRRLDTGQVRWRVDANNDTQLTVDDETAAAAGQVWAFWEADARNVTSFDPAVPATALQTRLPTVDGLTDLATVQLTVQARAARLELRLVSEFATTNTTTRWSLSPKVGAALAYLTEAAAGEAQRAATGRDCSSTGGRLDGRCDATGGTGIVLTDVQPGTYTYLFRCEACALDATRRLEVRDVPANQAPIPLDTAKTDLRPLREWMTVVSNRPAIGFDPLPAFSVDPAWRSVPSNARRVTVLVHGFAVSHDEVTRNFFPGFFRRLYWAGHPVMERQDNGSGPAHTVGVSWPGNEGGLPQVFFPEDEFNALRTGVPLGTLLEQLKAGAPGRTLNVFAHSLGNMAVNSALMVAPDHTVSAYVMNEAAVAAEAFNSQYTPSPDDLARFGGQAQQYGWSSNLALLDARWATEWASIQTGAPFVGPEDTPTYTYRNQWNSYTFHSQLAQPPLYELRWRQQRPVGWRPADAPTGPLPQRGAWRGLFARNADRVSRMVNSVNSGDSVLSIGWALMQQLQKPNTGALGFGADDASVSYWGRLPKTSETWDNLFPVRDAASANAMRQWSELAHWFPSLSGPAGLSVPGLASLSDPTNQRPVITEDFTSYSNSWGHSYLLEQPYASVASAFRTLASHLRF